jgi:ACS family hexuronate transporter-like MFS transporter
VTGVLGFVWIAIWAAVYRLPQVHPWISEAERKLILSDSGPVRDEATGTVPFNRLLKMPETWGCVMARLLTDPISSFLFFWTTK